MTSSYKLIATIPSLKLSRAFPLAPGRRYLLGSTEMETEMLVFSHDRSLSRRQAWLEIVGDKLRVERHPLASQKLNGDESVKALELEIGDDFTAGMTIFQFVSAEHGEGDASPDLTFVLSSVSYALWTREVRDFINVVCEMPNLMKANETPADFLLALCKALQKNVANLQVSAWNVKQGEDLPELVPLDQTMASTIRPSRHLVQKAMTLAGDECAVSFWHSRASTGDVGQSLISSQAQWAMCIAIALAEHERFALYATGAHALLGGQLNEVQQIFAAIGTMAKQHLLMMRAKERQGQIGQFFSPALRAILFDDITAIDQTLQPVEREAAICFFDLRGSSRLAEGMDVYAGKGSAVEHFALLEKILGNVTSLVFETGGMVIDFQGDALLACWGVPPQGAPENPARQAIIAARRIVEWIATSEWPVIEIAPSAALRCGLGLTCGKVLAGLFTAQGRFQTRLSKYTVIGRAVNQAARLEGMTKKFGVPILIDGALAAALADEKLLLRRIARVQPAGMLDVMEIYEVVLPREFGGTGIAADGIQAYDTALACFERGDFSGAASAMPNVSQDRIALFLHEHIMKYLGHPCPENWQGVISLVTK
jgi:class 3 adenylate cyclase